MIKSDIERRAKIASCQESGLTAKAWCKKEGINYQTYLGWLKRFKKRNAASQVDAAVEWVEALAARPADQKANERGEAIGKERDDKRILIKNGKWEVSITEGFSPSELLKVLWTVNMA